MEIKITRLSDEEISQLQEQLSIEIDRRAVERRREALLAAEATAEKYGFKLQELLSEFRGGTQPKQKRAFRAKYRHPEKPDLTWTGLGRKPKWLVAAVELGHSLDDMRIQ
ncbi:H-NS histone family protein [Epibacterium sp. MM17-32]|uniref:H-NS histone family protein n=1 Tax=Epibacterium sp. MM17-32 TaxID=2917734 RepID=UPI001EF4B59F|nr:H-NS histone family protein [Epibacterium sp. MM17-32]MCG7629011.1 H-NS histone family protein [Epibacterium sp. MM17-32]